MHKFDIPDIHVNTIMESRNTSFFENIFPCKIAQEVHSLKRSNDVIDNNNQNMDQGSIGSNNEKKLRRNKRAKMSKSFGPVFLTYLLENEPQSFKEAMSCPKTPF